MNVNESYPIRPSRFLVSVVVTDNPQQLFIDYMRAPHGTLPGYEPWPENHMSGKQMREFVKNVKPGTVIVTGSLYLYREFMMSKRHDVLYYNVRFGEEMGAPELQACSNPDEIENLEILDRDIEQSQRFMDSKAPNPPSKEMSDDQWDKEANNLARCYCPEIKACRHCNHPVVSGYCCSSCGSGTP